MKNASIQITVMRVAMLVAIATFAFARNAQAGESSTRVVSKAEAGLAVTSNANLETTNPKSDVILQMLSHTQIKSEPVSGLLRLAYSKYGSQTSNDVLNWKIGASGKPFGSSQESNRWTLKAALLGASYSRGSSGVTDTSYDSVGFETLVERSFDIGPKRSLLVSPGLQVMNYSGGDTRTDFRFWVNGEVDFEVTSALNLGGHVEPGFISSSRPEYSLVYLEMMAWADYQISARWDWDSILLLRSSGFTNRLVNQTTFTTRNRGNIVATTNTTNEGYFYSSLSSEGVYKISDSEDYRAQASFGFQILSQTSKSGYQDYSESRLKTAIAITF